ncbi:porin family protein [Paraflavitalea pollutisoli]|uniref:porin family protein n=1 Tax=Paraflavitalea pollutisoli TaxID=3034143 RepID=UPI0023EB0775|nr:porin family protein [Paraflavitalea sp. H1-2-19X]
MKKNLIIALFLLTGSIGFAQTEVRIGPKVGVNISSFAPSPHAEIQTLVGYQAGGVASFSLSKLLSVQPELFYSAEGATSPGMKYSLNYLRLPLLIHLQHASGFYAQAGPQAGYLLSGKSKDKLLDKQYELKGLMGHFETSFVVGLGYRLQQGFGFDLRYAAGLSRLQADSEVKLQTVTAGIHYLLPTH